MTALSPARDTHLGIDTCDTRRNVTELRVLLQTRQQRLHLLDQHTVDGSSDVGVGNSNQFHRDWIYPR